MVRKNSGKEREVSNCAINIRIWYWHWQVTFNNEWSWSINEHWYENKPWFNPIAIYDFMPWKIKRREK